MAGIVSHQTVRLSAGRHASAQDGVCVMELASMLAGEAFTDHPRAVDRGLGAFLRTYNDGIDDGRRQDLIELAAAVVGTESRRGFRRRRRATVRRELRQAQSWSAVWREDPAVELARCYLNDGVDGHRRALAFVRELTGEPPGIPSRAAARPTALRPDMPPADG